MPNRVDIVVVSYNSARVLGPTLAGLCGLSTASVTVVDNCSSDDSVMIAQASGAKVIRNDRNLGFGTGCNRGAAAGKAEFILFVNPDADVSADALAALLTAADRHGEAAAFNPQIVNEDGSPYRRGPGPSGRLSEGPAAYQDGEVDILSGAVLLCRRSAFSQIGGFDEKIFLFFEDDDLSMRLASAGWKLRQVGNARVVHVIGTGSQPSMRTALFKERCYAQARRYVLEKHQIPFSIWRERSRILRRLVLACLTFDGARFIRNLGRLQGYLSRS